MEGHSWFLKGYGLETEAHNEQIGLSPASAH
jgi:hypothetical protein